MKRTLEAIALIGALGLVTIAATPPEAGPDTPVIHAVVMVDFAFQPARITAHQGDVIQFVQNGAQPHNVWFVRTPDGVKLGDEGTSPFLVKKGQSWQLKIDSRFKPGVYEFVCMPHQTMGMTAQLTVLPAGS